MHAISGLHVKQQLNYNILYKTDYKYPFSLKLKEALYIQKLKPDINKQIQHVNTIFNL